MHLRRHQVPGRYRGLAITVALLLVALTGQPSMADPAMADPGLQVSRKNNGYLVSGRLENARLVPALASLASKAGFSLRPSPGLVPRQVSFVAQYRPLPETLSALLAGTEHIIERDAAGGVKTVYLFADGHKASATTAERGARPVTGEDINAGATPSTMPPGSASPTMQAALAATARTPTSEEVADVFERRGAIFQAFITRYGKSLPPDLIEEARRRTHGESSP